jgi:hypothetical protein
MAKYIACPDAKTAIYILDFIKRGYKKTYKDGGVLKYIEALEMGIDALKKQSTADVVEVKHGEWTTPSKINGNTFNIPHCSICNNVPCDVGNYCPFCGAIMDGGNKK